MFSFCHKSATEKDLHIYLDCEGAFDEEKACNIIYQLLGAIEFLHSKQILHLDIKVERLIIDNLKLVLVILLLVVSFLLLLKSARKRLIDDSGGEVFSNATQRLDIERQQFD